MKAILLASCLISSTAFLPAALSQEDEALDMEDLFAEDFESEAPITINDPLEGVNRAIFKFNDTLYTKAVKPFARAYTKVMPDPVERGIGNVFDNLKFPSRFASNVLQGRFPQAGRETGKFLVNTTVGIGGIFRVSDRCDSLDTSHEDVGQAFARWGIGHGFYAVLPLMGPTSLRDFTGDFADGAVEPIPTPWSQIDNTTDRLLLRAFETINELPDLMDLYDSMRRSAIDPYSAVRDAYAQRRASQAEN